MGKRERRGHGLLEFAVALTVLLAVVLPLINLIGLACGAAYAYFTTIEGAAAAADARDFPSALSAMTAKANRLHGGVASLWKVKPIGGLNGCGIDLYILSVNCINKSMTISGPNCQLPEPIDPSTYIYEFQTVGNFDVGPLLNLSSTPYVGDIPIISQPARLRFVGERAVENPKILEGPGTIAFAGGGQGANGGAPGGSGTKTGGNGGQPGQGGGGGVGWNYPHGFVFHTTVPAHDGTGGAYLITITVSISEQFPPDGARPFFLLRLTTIGQYIDSSEDRKIATQSHFVTPKCAGSSEAMGVNPERNFSIGYDMATPTPTITRDMLTGAAQWDNPLFLGGKNTPANEAAFAAWQSFIAWGTATGAIR